MSYRFRVGAALAIAALPLTLPAQHAASTQAGQRTAGTHAHRSAFSDYRRYAELTVADWRDVNRAVADATTKPASSTTGPPPADRGNAPLATHSTKPASPSGQTGTEHSHAVHGGAK